MIRGESLIHLSPLCSICHPERSEGSHLRFIRGLRFFVAALLRMTKELRSVRAAKMSKNLRPLYARPLYSYFGEAGGGDGLADSAVGLVWKLEPDFLREFREFFLQDLHRGLYYLGSAHTRRHTA